MYNIALLSKSLIHLNTFYCHMVRHLVLLLAFEEKSWNWKCLYLKRQSLKRHRNISQYFTPPYRNTLLKICIAKHLVDILHTYK